MNSDSSNITILRATEWKRDSPTMQFRLVLAHTGPGFTPLVVWEERRDQEGFFKGSFYREREVDEAHARFQKWRNRLRLKEQIPPQRGGALPVGVGSPELSDSELEAARMVEEDFDLAEERRRSLLRLATAKAFHDAGDSR